MPRLIKIITLLIIVFFALYTTPHSYKAQASTIDNLKAWMMPNQLAGGIWYKPDNGNVINGHVKDSFANFTLWPNALSDLRKVDGGFGLFAAEYGWTSSAFFKELKDHDIPVSVEMPGFTQCPDGTSIANAELNGNSFAIPGGDFFNTFGFVKNTQYPGRNSPYNGGWLVTSDGKFVMPDELVFDERLPGNLGPRIDFQKLATATGTIDQRIKTATTVPGCTNIPYASMDYSATLTYLMNDYVKYVNVFKTDCCST